MLSGTLGGAQFDYTSVPPPVARFLREHAMRIRRGHATSIIQIGRELIEAKHHLSYGIFTRWVQAEVGLPVRTAQAYMRVSQWAKDRSAAVAQLPPSVLYLVSAPSAPKEFVTDILNKLEAGESIDISVVRKRFKSLRDKNLQRSPVEITKPAEHFRREGGPPSSARVISGAAQAAVRDGRIQGEFVAPNSQSEVELKDAVAIMIRSMAPRDFAQVRNIMVNKSVLSDPQLAKKIEAAFSAFSRISARNCDTNDGAEYAA